MHQKNKSIKHILVIRLSAMGDVAMTVPVLRTLCSQYPDLKITVLSKPFFKPLFDDIENLDFYGADTKGRHRGISGLKKLCGELKKTGVDAVADLHNVLRSNILKVFFRISGIPFIQIDKGRLEKRFLTSGKHFSQLKTTHQRYADVFDKMGFPVDLSEHTFPQQKKLKESIIQIIGPEAKKWIGIAPFAAFTGKMYPIDLMEKVLDRLNGTDTCKLILLGGGDEEKQILEDLSDKYKNAINLVGKLSFEDELALISNLDLMLSMDSGNAHLAAIYGIKTVTLWGISHPYAGFYPFGQDMENALLSDKEKYPLIPTSVYGNKLPRGYENVMRTIQPEKVVEKVISLIK